jgi:hypothetical protein
LPVARTIVLQGFGMEKPSAEISRKDMIIKTISLLYEAPKQLREKIAPVVEM